ncbi:MAG: beta strand repeat-containing protein, partial [Erythrobacter sp.]
MTINTVIAGGNAGDPGNGLQGTPNASGGNGIIGSNLALNLGSDANVSGGVSFLAGPAFLSPPSRPRANAIVFSGGRNQLTAAAGAVIDGDISVTGHLEFFQDTDFVLASGITGDGSIEKSGVGTLTLTGSGTNVGGTIISGGTLQIGNGGSTGSLGPGDIINDASLVFNRSNDLTVANAISGVGGLTKRGGGILTLTGLNTYLGTTTISEGTLQIGARGTEGNLGRGDVINNASLVFNRSDFVLVENSISGTGSVSMRGIGTLYLTADNSFSGGLFVRQGTVIFNPGSVGTGTISLADETTLQSGALAPLNVANDISISVTGTATFRSFTSSRVNLDGIISGGNLAKTGESLVVFRNNANSFAGLDVRLGAVGITANGGFGSGTVTLQDNTTIVARAADLNVANAIELVGTGQILTFGQTLTLSGSIAGGTLVKADPGTLVLTGTNTYSGITRVSSGTLIAGNARALGTSTLGVGGAGSVVIADFDGEFANIHRVGDGGTLAAGSGRTVGLTGILSLGNDGVAKFGLAGQNGVLVFDQFAIGFPTSAPPATSIEGGTVRIGSRVASQFATLTQSSAFTSIQSAGTLDINGNSMELGKLNGTGTILNRGAAATLTLTNSTFAGTFDSGAEGMTLAGAITGESGFTKRGSGVLTLAADLDLTGFTGGFTLAEGTLSLRVNLASTFGSIRTTGSVIDYADGVISAAPIVIDSDTTRLQALSGAATQSGVISELGGARGFEKIGAGTLTLAAANTYTGAITVAEGTLHVTNEAALGGSGGGTTVLDGATLALGNTDSFMFVNEATTIRGNGVNNSGALRGELSGARLTRPVTLAGAARIGSESGTLVIGGGISGADHDLTVGGGSLTILASPIALGSGRLIKDGSTGLWLFDTQAQISELLIKSGEVVFLSDTGTINNTIADTAAVTLEGGALNLSLSETIGSLAGGANARVSTIAPSSTLTVGANNTSTEFAGVISSGLNLTKVGTGTLTLSGANTYTGTTRIEAGTLALGADNAIPGSPFLIISGGTLALGGFSQSVMVTGFSAGGISGPGTLDVLGSYSQSGGTIGAGAIVNLLDEGLLSGGTIAGTLNHIAPFPRRFGIEGGHVTVTGTLDVERILRVADVAATEVTVTNGGTVRAGDTFIASTIGANGSVTINGAGSNWNSDAFIVGRFGTGSLAITDGGQASSGDGVLGSQSGSTGLSTIDGAGSNWTNSLALVVGGNGSGTLAITNGGRATNVNALIANGFGSTGIATITGPGSGWESTGVLLVGRRGNGTLNISEGGLVTAANASIATVAGSVGTIVFGSSQGAAPTAAGRLLAPTLEFGAGSGAIVFNHTAPDFELASNMSGNGTLLQLAGITSLTGASGGFTGRTEITGGTLLVGGTLGGNVWVSGSGTLGGSGTLTGNVSINDGSTLAPGNSPGTLTIVGNLDLNAGSTAIFELGEAGVAGGANNDLVAVGGNLALNGGTIRIQRGAGFSG